MAYMLSLRPHSPLKRSFSDNPYLQTCSPLKDLNLGALRDISSRNASACSLYSAGSNQAGKGLRGAENTPPPLTSRSLLELVPEKENHGQDTRAKDHVPRKRSCGLNRPPPSFSRAVTAPSDPVSYKKRHFTPASDTCDDCETSSPEPMVLDSGSTEDDTYYFNLYEAIHVPIPEGRWSDNTGSEPYEVAHSVPVAVAESPQPFRRWMSTLRRWHMHRHRDPIPEVPALAVQMVDDVDSLSLQPSLILMPEIARTTSNSMSSSLGCVTAVRSASITVASTSIAPRSENGAFHGIARLGNRSSHYSEARRSTDSHRAMGPILDESAWLRSVQRWRIVEELIASEESYIADLKVLINVCLSTRGREAADNLRSGLFHDPNRYPCITSPNASIDPTKHLSDSPTARGTARRSSSSRSSSGSYPHNTTRSVPCN
jgi:hypothetical protein